MFEEVKRVGFTETILPEVADKHITFPLGVKNTEEILEVPVKIFVKFPPRVVDDDMVATHAALYTTELEPSEPPKKIFPLGRRTAPEKFEEGPAKVGPTFI